MKEAFDAEVKYWAAIAAEIRPRIGSRRWTDEQKHYAFWLLDDERRFSSLILGRAPINDKIGLSLTERKQVQSYIRRRARRMMGARPSVKAARSFVLDSTLYSVGRTLAGQFMERTLVIPKGEKVGGQFFPLLFDPSRIAL